MTPIRRTSAAARRFHGRYLLSHQLRFMTWLRFGRHHAAPIDPLRTLDIDPASIDSFIDMESADFLRIRHAFGIVDGDWDLGTTPLTEHFVFDSIHAHFVRNVPWDRTRVHQVAMEGILRGVPRYHGCRAPADLERRLQQLERLYETVRSHGYLSQRHLERAAGGPPLQRVRRGPAELGEIIVHIDRNGKFVFVDGIHRLSVAKVLTVPKVPVCVLYRHRAWQAHRDRVVRDPAAFPPSEFDHPDLAYLRCGRPRTRP